MSLHWQQSEIACSCGTYIVAGCSFICSTVVLQRQCYLQCRRWLLVATDTSGCIDGSLAADCSGSGITCGTSGIICIGSDVIRAGCSEPPHCDGSIEAAALWRKTRHSRLIEDILAYCGIIYDVNYIPHNFHAPFISRDPRTDTSAPWVDVVTNTCLALQSSYTLNHPILRVDCWPICPKTSPTYPCGIPKNFH